MATVWILEAHQGQWSDASQWIVNVYATLDAALNDPVNKFKLQPSRWNVSDHVRYDAVDEDVDGGDPIYYGLCEYDVIGGLTN